MKVEVYFKDGREIIFKGVLGAGGTSAQLIIQEFDGKFMILVLEEIVRWQLS